MNKKTFIKILIVLFMVISNVIFIRYVDQYNMGNMQIEMDMSAEKETNIQVYYAYTDGDNWSEEKSCKSDYNNKGKIERMIFSVPQQARKFRLDLGDSETVINIKSINIQYKHKNFSVDMQDIISDLQNDINSVSYENGEIVIKTVSGDPYIGLNFNSLNYKGNESYSLGS